MHLGWCHQCIAIHCNASIFRCILYKSNAHSKIWYESPILLSHQMYTRARPAFTSKMGNKGVSISIPADYSRCSLLFETSIITSNIFIIVLILIVIISSFKLFWRYLTTSSIVRCRRHQTLQTWPQNLIYFQTLSKFAFSNILPTRAVTKCGNFF